MELGRAIVKRDEEAAEEEIKRIEERAKKEEETQKKKEETILSFKRAGLQGAEMAATAVFDSKRSRLQAEIS